MRAGLADEDISLIYDTAVDDSLWPQLLERMADAVDGETSNIGVRDMRTTRPSGVFVRCDPTAYTRYWAYPFESIPLNAATWAPVGQFLTDEQQVARPTLLRSDYFHDFLRPANIGPTLTGVLRRDADVRWTMNLSRPIASEPFGPDEIGFVQQAVPHLVRLAAISTRLANAEIASRGAEAALDRLPSGVILLDARGTIRFANREAWAIASARDGLAFGRHGLLAERSDDTLALRSAVDRAVADPGRGATLRLARPSGAPALAVLVIPLRQDTDWLGATAVRALAVVTDPGRGHLPPEQRLQRLYGLTATEAALALQLLGGADLADIAERRGITVPTARLHLYRIMQKTGTTRQAELVRLMLRESLAVL